MTLMGGSAHIYHTIPPLEKPGNNTLLLLSWSTMVSGRQLDVLREWAKSENGWNLYKQLTRDVQDLQSVEQLTLTMTALMTYRRLHPDVLDHSHKPINGSYLADLDALFRGYPLGNSGRVAQQMGFALIRVLQSFVDQYGDITTFLETKLDRERPLLHVFDGFSDQYLLRRISGQSHEAARVDLSHIKMPELRGDDDQDWVIVTHPELPYSDCTLPAVKTEYVPIVLHVPTCSQLTYIVVLWNVLKAKIPLWVVPLIQSSTATRIDEEDMTPSHVVAVSSKENGHLFPPLGFRADA